MNLDANIPSGPMAQKWDKHRFDLKLVNPANKRKYEVIVVGSGLAGASAAASLAELGYNVKCFCYQDSPRRAHSIAAQGGINAAKNYQNDGDSVHRLFYDTVKGGDYRSREANVHRLAQVSVEHHRPMRRAGRALCARIRRSLGQPLLRRRAGEPHVLCARPDWVSSYCSARIRHSAAKLASVRWTMLPRTELLDVVLVDGHAKGVVVRDMVTGEISRHSAHAVVLATGGYGNVFYLSTNAMGCNVTATHRAYKRGAAFANPCYTQIHPTCIPVSGDHQSKLTLMSESLRNDGRVWVPKSAEVAGKIRNGELRPGDLTESERDYYLERKYPSFGNLVPRDVASRNSKEVCDEGRGVVSSGLGVYLDFADSISRMGEDSVRERYGNLFDMYEKITGSNAYQNPMTIYPAVHYTMGGLWVDYNLMSNVPGLFVIGEANFSDHGANRLGASALMQGLADGYFVLPYTIGQYLAEAGLGDCPKTESAEFSGAEDEARDRIDKFLSIKGKRTPTSFHRELGKIIWENCGMSRNKSGLEGAIDKLSELREEFWSNLNVPGEKESLNQSLELAGRVSDFLEFGQLMCRDALQREESCGGHFREEHSTPEGEAKRDDKNFAFVGAWEHKGEGNEPVLHKEKLEYEEVEMTQRSYK
jgi:succinate dehydrogenase / fumarate reductase flavoprotein subunit